MRFALISLLTAQFVVGCARSDDANQADTEGTQAGDCSDGSDNDLDGQFDCDDEDCMHSDACTDPSAQSDQETGASSAGNNDESNEENVEPDNGSEWAGMYTGTLYLDDGTARILDMFHVRLQQNRNLWSAPQRYPGTADTFTVEGSLHNDMSITASLQIENENDTEPRTLAVEGRLDTDGMFLEWNDSGAIIYFQSAGFTPE